MDTPTKYISLYSGAGGLDLGFRLANPDSRCVAYVERDVEACALLVDHMQTGQLDDAPLWSDSGTFNGRPYRGKVDFIIGGFPCQPWSVAGKQAGTEDERWLWPHIRQIIYDIQPRGAFLENVPGLLAYDPSRDVCVCGGDDRRGRLRWYGQDDEGLLLSEGRSRDDEQGSQCTDMAGADIQRQGVRGAQADRQMGRGVSLAYVRGARGALPVSRLSVPDPEETAGIAGNSTSVVGAQELRHGSVNSSRDKGAEPERAITADIPGGCVCGATSRPMAHWPENVGGGLATVVRDLASLGFDAEWTSVRASDVGAPHRRERIFILAYRDGEQRHIQQRSTWPEFDRGRREELAHTGHDAGSAEQGQQHEEPDPRTRQPSESMGDTDIAGSSQRICNGRMASEASCGHTRPFSFPPGPSDQWFGIDERYWPAVKPEVRGMADGMALGLARAGRLRLAGNGVVPQQAALAFRELVSRL